MYELNVNTLCSVTFLTLCSHHLPEKEILRFFVIVPDFFFVVADGSDCACSRHCEFGYSKHKIASINYCCESIIADKYSRVQLYGMIVIILVKCAARIIILPVHIVLKSIPLEPASEKKQDPSYLKNTFLDLLEIIGVSVIVFRDSDFDLIDIIIDAV